MKTTYFLYENGQVSPPYTIEDLKQKNLTGDTMICEKFGAWKPVREVPELQDLWEWTPPAPPQPGWVPPPVSAPNHEAAPANEAKRSDSSETNRRPLIPASFGLDALCFFFVFCDLKCGEQKIASVTGVQFITGIEMEGMDFGEFGQSGNKKTPPNLWAMMALFVSVLGCGAYLVSKNTESAAGVFLGILGAATMLALQVSVKTQFEKEGQGALIAEFQPAYWVSLLAMIAAAIISGTLPSGSKQLRTLPAQPPPAPPSPAVEDATYEAPPDELLHEEVELLDEETTINTDISVESEGALPDETEHPKKGVSKNAIFIGGAFGILLLAVSGYFLLFKPDSVADASNDALLSEGVSSSPASRQSPAGKSIETVEYQSTDVKKQIVKNLITKGRLTQADVKVCGGAGKVIYDLQNIDLDEDGTPEYIASFFCVDSDLIGFSVFRSIADEVEEIFDCAGCERQDISPSNTYTNGWRDLELSYYSAGTGESDSEILRWNGRCYQNASNPCSR